MRIEKKRGRRKLSGKLVGILILVAVGVMALVQIVRQELDPNNYVVSSRLDQIENIPTTKRQMTVKENSQAVQKQRTKIVGFANDPYKQIATQWFDRLSALGYDEHVIIATDNETAAYLEQQQYRYEYVPRPDLPWSTATLKWAKKERLRKLYLFAMRWTYILKSLKEEGTSILLTDVDNIFSRYVPMSDFEESEFDVFHAYETKHPTEVFDAMGFVVCGGMGWFRADPKTIKFIEILLQHCGDNCDDQVELNIVLSKYLDMQWNETPETSGATAKRVKSKDDERYDGLLEIGKTGKSKITGHRVKIWDRNFAFRGPLEPDTCPENNWVSMPIYDMHTRQHAPAEKSRSFDRWDAKCPSEYSMKMAVKK